MSLARLQPPPSTGNRQWDRWFSEMWRRIVEENAILWANIDKSGADINDIPTRSHTELSDRGINTHPQIDSSLGNLRTDINSAVAVNVTQTSNIGTLRADVDSAVAVNNTQTSNISDLRTDVDAAVAVNVIQTSNIGTLRTDVDAIVVVDGTQTADIANLRIDVDAAVGVNVTQTSNISGLRIDVDADLVTLTGHINASLAHGVGGGSAVVGTATNQALTNKLITLQSALKQLTTDTQTANAGSATQTSADLTDSTGGVVGLTIVDVTAAHDQAVLNANFASITDQVKKLVVEIGLLITYVNSIQTTTNDTLTKLRKTTGCGILDG